MTGTQTDDLLNKGKGEGGYGLGFSTTRKAKADGPRSPGRAGTAVPTQLTVVNPDAKLVTVYMVQHAGFGGDGKNPRPAFEKAALDIYGK